MLTKRCGDCGETKALDQFSVKQRADDPEKAQRQSYCKPCQRIRVRQHYGSNREYYLAKAKRSNSKLTAERRAWLVDYLTQHPCVDCGETDLVVLQFDHVDGTKVGNMSFFVSNRKMEVVLAEAAKCEVVCANCHVRRTAKRSGWDLWKK